jgi:membrane-bound lytic murein transglycosylase F
MPSCDPGSLLDRPVAPLSVSHELVVLTRNSPTTRYVGADGNHAGMEQDLVSLFAKDLGVTVRFVERNKISQILPALDDHAAHLAAAGLGQTPERRASFNFAPPYLSVRKVVVYNQDHGRPRVMADLVGKRIEVVAGSSSARQLQIEARQIPKLKWVEVAAEDSDALLARLADNELDVVVADSNSVDLARTYFPNLAVAFPIGTVETVAWAFPRDGDASLLARAQVFFKRIENDGTLKNLVDRYYGHTRNLDQNDIMAFLERRTRVLPRFRNAFRDAQELCGLDWRLLAALGFQESHWNPYATSPTGVRGLMMLTEATADRMKVSDRLDPRESILAGARYLQSLRETLPERIAEPDRTWLALAAYNVGLGHLEDARILAQRKGLNPDSWADVKSVLPLLAQSPHYGNLKYGFARGHEAVTLTENIRNYYAILVRFEDVHAPLFPSLTAMFRLDPGRQKLKVESVPTI